LLSVVAPLEGYHLFFTSEVNPVKSFIWQESWKLTWIFIAGILCLAAPIDFDLK
jgi:hypothetical protein